MPRSSYHPPQSLSPLHEEAALLLAQGHAKNEVATHLGVTPEVVYHWWHSPLFLEKVNEFKRQIQAESLAYATHKMTVMQTKAVDRLEHLMDYAESEAVQLGAVREVLERGPLRIQRGPQMGQAPQGTVILETKMLLAMKHVALMTGDSAMQTALEAVTAQESPTPESDPPDASHV